MFIYKDNQWQAARVFDATKESWNVCRESRRKNEAADFLNVSRPHLIKLLEHGEMHFETVGRHRRVKAVDVFEYKVKRNQARSKALSELAETDSQFL